MHESGPFLDHFFHLSFVFFRTCQRGRHYTHTDSSGNAMKLLRYRFFPHRLDWYCWFAVSSYLFCMLTTLSSVFVYTYFYVCHSDPDLLGYRCVEHLYIKNRRSLGIHFRAHDISLRRPLIYVSCRRIH